LLYSNNDKINLIYFYNFAILKQTLKQVGGAFTETFKQVGQQAKTVGQGLLEQLKAQGTQLAGQALKLWIYNLVHTTCLWNLHQEQSAKHWEDKSFKCI
jgi:hypothetical protein